MNSLPSATVSSAPPTRVARLDPEALLRLRILILALGQREAADWWPCSFLNSAGLRFLSTPFPRSSFWAAIHASATAAARHHDGPIGSGGTVHLFRLGQEVELILRDKVLRDGWRPDFDPAAPAESLKGLLQAIARTPGTPAAPGPLRVSDRKSFLTPRTLELVAGYYLSAFDRGIQILPYGADQ